MAMTAEAIIFAINSAIRLGRNAQRAYTQSLTSQSITLPLPDFSGTANAFTAQRFFLSDEPTGGGQYLGQIEHLRDIHDRFQSGEGDEFPTDEELAEYVNYYQQLNGLLLQEANADFQDGFPDDRINADEFVALLRIRQYNFNKKKHTRPLQIVAGTLVEIGIDYFNRVPGALNEQSASGRAIQHFLAALDDIPFNNNEQLRKHSPKIIPQLFISAAEALTDLSPKWTKDPKIQAFIEASGQGIAQDLFTRMEGLDADRQDEAIQWGRILLRSAVANAGHYVFNVPQRVFKTNQAATALIQSTGNVLLEAILKDPHQLRIREGLNADTLDRLLETSFSVFAEYPELIHRGDAFQKVVEGMSTALAGYNFRRPDLFPELVRLVLEHTGRNLHLFWQKEGEPPQAQMDQARDLMIQAVQLILHELSQPVDDDQWRPHLSKSQLLFITEELLERVVQNPAWLEREVNNKPLLASVIRVTIDALASLPREERFSAEAFQLLLELNLRTVAANELVLQKVGKWGDDQQKEEVLQQALTLVFAHVFHHKKSNAGDRIQLLMDLLDYVLDIILEQYPDRRGLLLIDLILFENEGVDFTRGFDREWANSLIDAGLQVLATHPDLVIRDAALSQIISELATTLDATSFQQEDFLVDLVRMTLESTAINAGLILKVESDHPKYLLVTFIRELLLALSQQEDEEGGWQPHVSPAEALVIVDNLVNELIQHPEWIVEGPDGQVIFQEVMVAVRAAFKQLPEGTTLGSTELEYLIALALRTAATSRPVLDKIPFGSDTEKKAVLERAMAIIGSFVFEELDIQGSERIERFVELVEYVMQVILVYHPNKKGLLLLQLILFEDQDMDYSRGFDDAFVTELLESTLRVFQQHPDLVSQDQAIQAVISDTAAALDAADFRQPGILPELVRLVLENTALNSQLIIRADANEPRFLLVIVLQSLLEQLSAQGADGKWRPALNGDDVLAIAEDLLEVAVDHPEWLVPHRGTPTSLWEEVTIAILEALGELPKGSRIDPQVLEDLILLCLYTAANSPTVLEPIQWADDESEQIILNKALDLLIAHVYPPDTTPSPQRWEQFMELLDFVLETIITQYPDKRSLILLDLLFFESEVDLSRGFNQALAEDLVDASLSILNAHPELITKDEIFRKILQDTAGALRASRIDLQHLLPEFFRLILQQAAGHLETLMNISPNSPRILLAVALEQALRVLTQKRRGEWRPTLTDEQLLLILESIMERVVDNPQWVDSNRLIQVTLEAIYSSLGEIKNGQTIPFATVHLLVEAGLEAVGQRQQLVLNVIETEEGEQVVLRYALGSVFVELYDEQGNTAGAWTLTQTETLQTILTHLLLSLAVGPANQETADELLQAVRESLDQINNDLAFTLDELVVALQNV